MKLVYPLQILGAPNPTERKHTCPICKVLGAGVHQDGSFICANEKCTAKGQFFAPEPADGPLWVMRQQFDARHGITSAERAEAAVEALGVQQQATHDRLQREQAVRK